MKLLVANIIVLVSLLGALVLLSRCGADPAPEMQAPCITTYNEYGITINECNEDEDETYEPIESTSPTTSPEPSVSPSPTTTSKPGKGKGKGHGKHESK